MAQMTKEQIQKAFARARAAQAKGQFDEAEKLYARILRAAPGLAEVHFNLAEIAARRGRMADAAQSFEAALKLRPGEPAIWVAYLDMASKHPNPKNFDLLRKRARSAIGTQPAFAFFEGLAQARRGAHDKALERFDAAVSGGYKTARVLGERAQSLAALRRREEALEGFDAALELAPKDDLILYRKAELLRAMGDLAQAKVAALRAIDAAPHMGGPYALYVSLGKVAADDPNIARMRAALKSKRSGDPDITTLTSALAKAMEDTGQTDKVFTYLNRGNAVAAKVYPFDADAATQGIASIKARYLELRDIEVEPSDAAPIFVTGAPRSGTTLVEQILASHSAVEGGGELGWIQPKINPLLTGEAPDAAREPDALLGQVLSHVHGFAAYLNAAFPGAGHVTDKSISSYATLGVLHKLMPNARFIVVRRDPRDNALSVYKNQFERGLHRYSNDLRHIALFLRQFEEMVGFWRLDCPGAFHEIRYEDLIAEPGAQSRALVAAVGLEWEDACLSFYETKREVRTLSSAQVRQPIYSSSVGAWKTYEAEMAPFLEAYGAVE
ncbi:tetratricopeptide repeat protein [Litoreibacter ponti]|uniref:Tetratricopeptide repeat protein n=1 Tax=Litoreibacter ponti TaxID=1510457 RepID=A0A2T6BLT7_9RHOB|nr:tetratricopeptide repeat-containing sulfotransferase family protein [Litoreibacter ponti]PTX57026.1 tetratricopeptide repeat protein [Litoreibacter ponti]